MPVGYRLVFNLYVFEEKKHSEIAEILNISEGTSKSQLNKAKKWLAEFLKAKENEKRNAETIKI
jgi:RNA polymerase sigma-70 factor (ECF subfamily)